jgi:hypothetical protein
MHITKLIQLLSDVTSENIDENANYLSSLFILKYFHMTIKPNFFFFFFVFAPVVIFFIIVVLFRYFYVLYVYLENNVIRK